MSSFDIGDNPTARRPTPYEKSVMRQQLETPGWKGSWVEGTQYYAFDQVLQNGWLAIATADTTDPPEPEPEGPQFYPYQGIDPTSSISSKLVVSGNRYFFPKAGILSGYRVYVIGGNEYTVTVVEEPTGTPIYRQIASLNPQTTGWVDLSIEPVFVGSSTTFDLIISTREPDPTPTVYSGNWNYVTQNNDAIPTTGTINHSNKTLTSLRVHKTDDDGGDRSVELASMTIGDVISTESLSWAIQSIKDNGTWIDFSVAPAQQSFPTGVQNFDFETVVSTPITYLEDADYWLTSQFAGLIRGVIATDGDYQNATVNDSAYGTDILIQDFVASPDWDILAYSDLLAGASGNSPGIISINSNVSPSYNQFWFDSEVHGVPPTQMVGTSWEVIEGYVADGPSKGIDGTIASSEMVIDQMGIHRVSVGVSATMSNNRDYDFGLRITRNASVIEERRFFRLRDGGDCQSGEVSQLISLEAGDKLHPITKASTANADLDPETLVFHIERIREV